MQTNPEALTRREFFRGMVPGWLTWNHLKAILYAVALVSLIYVVVSTLRGLGFADTIKITGVFGVLLIIGYLIGRISEIAEAIFKRCPKLVKAFLRTFGLFASYVLFGFCGIFIYERWKADGDIGQMLVALLIFFALQLRDELEKQD
jgi:hypothetical protein